MIDLSTAAIVTKLVGDAVGAIDKIYRGYVDFIKGKSGGDIAAPPPDFAYFDSPDEKAFVAKSRHTGQVYQKVSYEDLCKKLTAQDRAFIETLSRSMENYQKLWNYVYLERSMAGGLERARLDLQLDHLAKQMAEPLIKVLEFVERMGLWLDDHYLAARQLAAEYLDEGKGAVH